MAQGVLSGTVARNAPCPCGSGKKYKQCCMRAEQRSTGSSIDSASLHRMMQRASDLHARGDLRRAATLYNDVLHHDPQNAEALHLLGVTEAEQGRPETGIEYIGRAIMLNPKAAHYYRNLSSALLELGDLAAVVGCLHEAVAQCPNDGPLHRLLGEALLRWGDPPAAMESFKLTLQISPTDGLALRNLGDICTAQGNPTAACEFYQAALRFVPEDLNLRNNYGMALLRLERYTEAIAHFEHVVQRKPDAAGVRINLIHARQMACDWDGLEELWALIRSEVFSAPHEQISPFSFAVVPTTGEEQLACARNWTANSYAALEREGKQRDFSSRRGPRARLHLGYLSSDFREHRVARLIASVFEQHDRDSFLLSGYSTGPDDGSDLRRRIECSMDRFVDLTGVSAVAAAQRIFDDGVDILLDLNGYTQLARPEILALRPAPIQVNCIMYASTMGASFIDYAIVDDFVVPEVHRHHFSERLAYMPDSYLPYDTNRPIAVETPTRAACGLPEVGFVFCSFNHTYKITPAVFSVWLRLLAATADSVLWLLETNQWACDILRQTAQAAGINPTRLVFAPRMGPAEHLARQRAADLFLDTMPVNAHTTCADALWVGLPVLSCAGETLMSRVAGSLLHAVGLPELVTDSLEEYEALALTLAQEPGRLAGLRARLAANRTTAPLFDSARYTRNLEALCWKMWEASCRERGGIPGDWAPLTV